MNNSISIDVSIIYTHTLNVTPEHTTAINSQCWTGYWGGGIAMCFVK